MRKLVFVVLAACGGGGDDGVTPGGSCSATPSDVSGEGTYYAADGTGNCGFDASPSDLNVAAMNSVDYNNAAWCGACLEVSGPTGKVVVRVVDQCPECKHGDLDLSPQAFGVLSPLSAGRIPIAWHEVACDVNGPIAYHFKDGANAYWTAIQIRNHRYPIASVEAQVGGAYQAISRVDYNYFVQESGLGPGPYMLRVTDTHGQMLEDAAIALGDNTTRAGAGQFPACP
ncbi:MAG TPA: expansin EXLX1 family cellulose-binding protein [Kofleriaceae bacterium]|jgi:expansin (peptidoglycan-binding protein)|nr:expansin EXLX1 family cellulose-binding protein [Kofleriaceae bacterium]